jgi:hypothetical protein
MDKQEQSFRAFLLMILTYGSIARQRLDKHAPAITKPYELCSLWAMPHLVAGLHNNSDKTMFSMWSVPRLYEEIPRITRVEAGSNTSTVSLRVVGGDEKGSLKSETVKYGHDN